MDTTTASMNQVIPGLWIGDLRSAFNTVYLKANGIYSILSAMRGRLTIHETFIRHQILVDDTDDADILTHFLPAIHFIQAELDKGRGVLVHCQAGVSRSSTIVAAYLMYSKNIDAKAALDLIKQARPYIDPNQGFLQQLELFHEARHKISRREKSIRMFYMDRTTGEVMNGDGSPPITDMFARYPRSPSDSVSSTPAPAPRRRIRCKMCRQELATREHMLDHGQLGPATPAIGNTPASSRRPSTSTPAGSLIRSHSGSSVDYGVRKASRQPSFSTVLGDSVAMMAIDENSTVSANGGGSVHSPTPKSRTPSTSSTPSIPEADVLRTFRGSSAMTMASSDSISALEDDDEDLPSPSAAPPRHINLTGATPNDIAEHAVQLVGNSLSDAVLSTPVPGAPGTGTGAGTVPVSGEEKREEYFVVSSDGVISASNEAMPDVGTLANGSRGGDPNVLAGAGGEPVPSDVTQLMSAGDVAGQLLASSKLAALRSPGSGVLRAGAGVGNGVVASTPILANPKCSGYFVEPMKWMDHFLSEGALSGKITCPNKKCGAKLGNYDWAGQCCGCKEWVTPGFCINRSKVDEIV